MRRESGRRSGNVEDRRGIRATRGFAGGGTGTIVLVLVAMYFGILLIWVQLPRML